MLLNNIKDISKALFENFKDLRYESIVYILVKIIKKIILNEVIFIL